MYYNGSMVVEQGKRFFKRFSIPRRLAILVYFSSLAIFITFPLVLHLGDSVIGSIGDNIYFVWLIRWYQKTIFELHISPFFNPLMNYPEGWNLSTTDTALATALPGTLVSLLAGPIVGYNLAALFTFFLSGLSMYFWVSRLTGQRWAGIVAGTIYACLPFRMAHFLVGHLNLMGTQWFPIYFMGLYEILRRKGKSPGWGYILLTAVSLGLIAFTSMYYLYMTLLISLIFGACFLFFEKGSPLLQRAFWIRLGLLAGCCLPLLAAALLPFFRLSGAGELADRSIEYVSMYSASLTDFIMPSTDHFLWGNWIMRHFDRSLWIESSLYVGTVALILAGVAIARQSKDEIFRKLILISICTAFGAFVLALGTDLHWLGKSVEIQIPVWLRSVVPKETTPIVLPGTWLFEHLPFFSKMRALMRFGVFTLVFSSLMAGMGAAWLLIRVRLKMNRSLLGLVLVVLILLDFYPGPYGQFSLVKARPVDGWLAAQPGNGAVAQFPASQLEDQDQVYYTLFHQKPYIGGFFNANQPAQYQRIAPILATFPNVAGRDVLRELKVQYIIVDSSQYGDYVAVDKAIQTLGFTLLTIQEKEWVYGFKTP